MGLIAFLTLSFPICHVDLIPSAVAVEKCEKQVSVQIRQYHQRGYF